MDLLKKIYYFLIGFSRKIGDDHVRAYSAEASFFIIMCIFPILMLLLSLLRLTPFNEQRILFIMESITPFEVSTMLKPVIHGLFSQSGLVPTITILALWTAGKAVIGVMDGLNYICRIEEERNYIILRIRAMFYAMILILALSMSLVILVFGYDIQDFLKRQFPFLKAYSDAMAILPTSIAVVILIFLFSVFYAFLPNHRQRLRKQIPGAIFAAITWCGFSYIFAIYINYAGSMTLIYGSLTALILVMLWLYFCMYLLFIGAELNQYLQHPELFHYDGIKKGL